MVRGGAGWVVRIWGFHLLGISPWKGFRWKSDLMWSPSAGGEGTAIVQAQRGGDLALEGGCGEGEREAGMSERWELREMEEGNVRQERRTTKGKGPCLQVEQLEGLQTLYKEG